MQGYYYIYIGFEGSVVPLKEKNNIKGPRSVDTSSINKIVSKKQYFNCDGKVELYSAWIVQI